MKTRAAILTGPGRPWIVDEVDLEAPHDTEVRIRLVASGVCHSDYHLVTGATVHPMPCVAGHEGAGIVETVGRDVTRVQVGDRVVLSWAPDCGFCFYCQRNRPNLCETFAPISKAACYRMAPHGCVGTVRVSTTTVVSLRSPRLWLCRRRVALQFDPTCP